MSLKTNKSKQDVSKEKELIQNKIINSAKSEKVISSPQSVKKSSKKRVYQAKKMLYMDDELASLWHKYVGQEFLKGTKITYQAIAEKLLKDFLLRNIKD